MTPEDTITYRDFTIEIHRDDDAGSVEESLGCGNVTLYAWHRRYNFGEKPPAWATEAMEEGRLREAILAEYPEAVILPVYMYEHSGISLSTGREWPFNDRWDSGQLGVIFTTERMAGRWDEATKTWVPAVTLAENQLAAEAFLRAVVKDMDDRVRGNVWGFVIRTPEGERGESCWGYVGDMSDNGLLDAARDSIDTEVKSRESGERLVAEAFAL